MGYRGSDIITQGQDAELVSDALVLFFCAFGYPASLSSKSDARDI